MSPPPQCVTGRLKLVKKPFGLVPIALFSLISGLCVGIPLPAHAADTNHGPGEDRYIVRYTDTADVSSKAAELQAHGVSVKKTFNHALKAAVVTATPAQAADLAHSDRVASVDRDTPVHISDTQPNAPWGLDRTDQRTLPVSGSYTPPSSGTGVAVYVVDTGVLSTHQDFGGRVTAGYNAVNVGTTGTDDGKGTSDCNGHGTHVSGIAAGSQYGMAKSATIVPVRVLDCSGGGYSSDVIVGLDWMVQDYQAHPGRPAVANLSLSGDPDANLDAAVQNAIDKGITVTLAAGNSSADACTRSPARVQAALTVAASDTTDHQAFFSNYGPCVDLYAPGVQITSDWNTSTTATAVLQGTSMAAPHVAGAATMLLAAHPSWSPAQVASSLTASATAGTIQSAGAGTPNRLLYVGPDDGNGAVMSAGGFVARAPYRALDTRNGTGGINGAIGPGQTVSLTVTGRGGIPATGVSAVAMNVTVTAPTSAGFITAYAGGTAPPTTSNVNYGPGQTVPNFAVTPVATDGTVSFTNNSSGTVHLIADTSGYYLAGIPVQVGTFKALDTPRRKLDTRYGTGGINGPVGPGQTIRVKLADGVDVLTGASAIAMNITATASTSAGVITAYAGGTTPPKTSNVNYGPAQTVPNFAIVPVASDGTVAFTNTSDGTVQLIADISGYVLGGAGPRMPGAFNVLAPPQRQFDSRTGGSPVGPGQTITVQIAGQNNVPASGVSAAALNITVTEPTSSGFITAFPGGGTAPDTSNVNYGPGQTVPNFAITPVGADGTLRFTNNSNGTVQLIADTFGYFIAG